MRAASSLRRGFTLIELLVVISIIAMLVAILLPTLQKARDQVKYVDCMSRGRQITVAMLTYNNEFNEWWPIQYYNAAGPQDYRAAIIDTLGKRDLLQNYREWNSGHPMLNPMTCGANYSLGVHRTASFWVPAPLTYFDSVGLHSTGVGTPRPSAFISCWTVNPFFGMVDVAKPRQGLPKKPARVFMLAEAYREARPNYWYISSGRSFFRFRHFETRPAASDGVMNMSYMDGHLKSWKYEVGGEIWPTSGNGLWTAQRGFLWWGDTRAQSLNN